MSGTRKSLYAMLATCFVLVSIFAAACSQPTPEMIEVVITQVVKETQIVEIEGVEVIKEVEREVEVEIVVTATREASAPGVLKAVSRENTWIIGGWEFTANLNGSDNFNPYMNVAALRTNYAKFVYEALMYANLNTGEAYPWLASFGAAAKRRTKARIKELLLARKDAAKTMAPPDGDAVLEVRNLHVVYETAEGPVKAVNDVSFTIKPGERMGLIGESGSGKTTAAIAMMRLSRPPAFITKGQVLLEGRDLMSIDDEALRRMRLKEIAMVPQASMNALNPVMRIGDQIKDALVVHEGRMSKRAMQARVDEAFRMVDLPIEVGRQYPHQLSGGMKQRATMAIAVALRPKVILADEPTSALDVVVQKRVMLTLMRLQRDLGAAVLLIGHDIGLMTQFVDKLGVLYAGRLVEWAPVADILDNAYHPYSRMLIESLPTLTHKKSLIGIPGMPPQLLNLPPGCPFAPRCPFVFDRCREVNPEVQTPAPDRQVACHLYPSHSSLPPLPIRGLIATAAD